MENLHPIALLAHIISGIATLGVGSLLMILKKGDKLHQKLGMVFFYAMLLVTITSIYLSWFRNIPFLFFIGIFVFYQNYSGYRSIKNKSLEFKWYDGLVLLIALINAIFMIKTLNIILLVFGLISLLIVFTDLKIYYTLYQNKKLAKLTWLSRHIGMMIGAYIGALTAFLVRNIHFFQPSWVIWLAPTFVLIPLMRYFNWKYTVIPQKRK